MRLKGLFDARHQCMAHNREAGKHVDEPCKVVALPGTFFVYEKIQPSINATI
jgi:hypothetical protein